ncbi:MAG: hypothetical protein GX037_06720, partial [Trueperella sp.]|nr:hypothetical protein [Trueperella sp.]
MTIDPRTVQRVAKVLSGGGPPLPQARAKATVRDLRTQAMRAPHLVSKITGLTEAAKQAAKVEVLVVDRASWAGAAAVSIEAMLPPEDNPIGTAELSLVLSAVAPRILGQFDPYTSDEGRLYLIAPNVASFRQNYDLDRRDLSLWVAVHELTHAVQFAAAPWLTQTILDHARTIMSLSDTPADTEATEATEETTAEEHFERITATMSLLEGHAEYVMNNVPRQRMPGRDRIIEAMADRRSNKNPLVAFISNRMGMTAKVKQYTGGEKFVEGVIDRAGMDVFNRVWERAEHLPTA